MFKIKDLTVRNFMSVGNTTQAVSSHCGATGSGPSMQRWHFKNCKYAKN